MSWSFASASAMVKKPIVLFSTSFPSLFSILFSALDRPLFTSFSLTMRVKAFYWERLTVWEGQMPSTLRSVFSFGGSRLFFRCFLLPRNHTFLNNADFLDPLGVMLCVWTQEQSKCLSPLATHRRLSRPSPSSPLRLSILYPSFLFLTSGPLILSLLNEMLTPPVSFTCLPIIPKMKKYRWTLNYPSFSIHIPALFFPFISALLTVDHSFDAMNLRPLDNFHLSFLCPQSEFPLFPWPPFFLA